MTRSLPPRPPEPPENSGWSFEELLKAFGAVFPRWMRRFGVLNTDIPDALQDVHLALWLKRQTISTDKKVAKKEVFAIVAAVARDWYRDAQKRLKLEPTTDTPNPQHDEEWIARRLLWLEALRRLDQPSRDLIIARAIEEKTYEVIGAELNEKPDTIRKRFDMACEKLQNEVIRLLGSANAHTDLSDTFWSLMWGFTPFDRALLQSFLEIEQRSCSAPTARNEQYVAPSKGGLFGGLPMSVMLGALVMLPGELPNKSSAQAAKISDVFRPNLVFDMATPTPAPPAPATVTSVLSNKAASARPPRMRHSGRSITLDDATKASFRGVVSKSSAPP